jgi:hypothetical protein
VVRAFDIKYFQAAGSLLSSLLGVNSALPDSYSRTKFETDSNTG